MIGLISNRSTARSLSILFIFGWVAIASTAANSDEQQREADPLLSFARALYGKDIAVSEPWGTPPSREVRRGSKRIGYVLSSQAVVASKGYSGHPFDIAVALGLDAKISGASIISHQEPILEIGVSDEDLRAFVQQYVGHDVRVPARVERRPLNAAESYTAVSGATVSSVVLSDAIVRSARAVARARNLIASSRLLMDVYRPGDWASLLDDNSVVHHKATLGEAEAALAATGGRYFPAGLGPDDQNVSFLDLYVALATPAGIGRNLLGEKVYARAVAALTEGDQLLFVAGRGLYSFKGTAYVRSGVFDRIQLVQGSQTIQLTKENHKRVERVVADGSPDLREIALFRVPRDTGFDPTAKWRLDVLVSARAGDNRKAKASFPIRYELPAAYLKTAVAPVPLPSSDALWQSVWLDRAVDIGVLILALIVMAAVLFFQDSLARHRRAYTWVRNGFLVFTLVWVGWYAGAQLSVLNVLTFTTALRSEFRWDFFLLDPLIFILWGFVAVALLFWGRGVFCGWLCPFGALQELSNKLARFARIPQVRLPFAVHERIWPLKYVLFVGLFGASLGQMGLAQLGIEIEPFKTAIVLGFVREWPFVLYAMLLLFAGLFIERFFCRYLCPLGAALALPARIHMFDWLKRRWQCGLQCHICDHKCPVQAIHPDGRINPNECIHCLHCQVLYSDDTVCPPLVERTKRKESKLTRSLVKRFETAERKGEESDAANETSAKKER